MTDQQISAEFSAPIAKAPKDVWESVKDFGDLSWAAAAGLGDVVVNGEGVGMIRCISMPGSDKPVVERLVAVDQEVMSLTYVVDHDSLPGFKNYAATAQVKPADNGAVVTWSLSARAPVESADDMQVGLKGMAEGLVTLFAMQFSS